MRVVVMGAGGVGGYFGALLSRGGQDVTFVARGAHLEAINRRGLRVESVVGGDFVARAPATGRLDGHGEADLVLFCVKSYHNADAIGMIAPVVGAGTSVLTLQNGVGSGSQLATAFGAGRVLVGAAYVDATRVEPGLVRETGARARIVFGAQEGSPGPRSRDVEAALRASGVDATLSADVAQALWAKLVYISALSGMTSITRAPLARVLDNPHTLELTGRVLRETAAVAKANGVHLSDDAAEATMAVFQRDRHRLASSMHRDLLAGNPLEVDVINGAVSRIGRDVGVETPVNDFITACLAMAHEDAMSRLRAMA